MNEGLARLGAIVLTGCLMMGNPAAAEMTTPDWAAVAQVRLSAPVSASLAPGNESNIIPHSSIAHGQSTRSSMTEVLHAALGTALAAAWLMGGAWVGVRSTRISTSLDESVDRTRNAYPRTVI